ncbi:hypothetical protein [Patulibacter minatonensis]|uniref:hypothetical protein n=1 Tax=Patulibacter minatonensis TaxID=298163 RepID=UPI00047CD610|nr:hypothetical protein [Patulibacter minatonensis]
MTAPSTPTAGAAAAQAAEDRELEAWKARLARRSVGRVRVAGALAGGAAFLAVLVAASPGQSASTWGLAVVALAAVVVACHVGVRLAARPGRPEPGRLTADYVAITTGAIVFAIVGYPAASVLGLLKDTAF